MVGYFGLKRINTFRPETVASCSACRHASVMGAVALDRCSSGLSSGTSSRVPDSILLLGNQKTSLSMLSGSAHDSYINCMHDNKNKNKYNEQRAWVHRWLLRPYFFFFFFFILSFLSPITHLALSDSLSHSHFSFFSPSYILCVLFARFPLCHSSFFFLRFIFFPHFIFLCFSS